MLTIYTIAGEHATIYKAATARGGRRSIVLEHHLNPWQQKATPEEEIQDTYL